MIDTPVNEDVPAILTPAQQARILLKLIARGVDNPNQLIEIRTKRAAGGMDCAFFGVAEIDTAVAHALEAGATRDTYVGMGLRNRRAGSADAVDEVRLLWADCDSDEALDGLAAFNPAPSITVRSGGLTERGRPKVHAYWPLKHPLAADRVKPVLQRLVVALRADPACVDVARIMRVPGTFNFKSDPPATVVLEIR